jgi:hypothetical protein
VSQFAHILVFGCPNCKFPIVVGCLSDKRNLEDIDAQFFALTCADCKHSFNLVAVEAVRHYVEEWPHRAAADGRGRVFLIGARVRVVPNVAMGLLLNPNIKEWLGVLKAEKNSETGQPTKYLVRLDNGKEVEVLEHQIARV